MTLADLVWLGYWIIGVTLGLSKDHSNVGETSWKLAETPRQIGIN